MKSRTYRLCSLLLALLVLLSASPDRAFAAQSERLDPACELGADPADMLAGGGRFVRVGNGQYYIDETDGYIYYTRNIIPGEPDPKPGRPDDTPAVLIYDRPAAKLNYWKGLLYFARLKEDGFDLCSFDLARLEEKVLLENVKGEPGQLYVLDGKTIQFNMGESIMELDLETGVERQLYKVKGLFSFVPTGCGPICAVGSLLDYTLLAGPGLIARHVSWFEVDLSRGRLFYRTEGRDEELSLVEAFRAEPEPDDGEADPEDQTWKAEPDGQGGYRAPIPQGAVNIAKRARQMLNIQWTPVKNIKGWGYDDSSYTLKGTFLYKAGVTYTGLPYCQGCNYVPWTTSLSGFADAVSDAASLMYTSRSTYWRGGPYYGTDCSGFVSWAWDLPNRAVSITPYGNKISSPSYSKLQVGDMLSRSGHAMLVTDVVYDSTGAVASVEISHANPTVSTNACANSMVYSGSELSKVNKLFGSYALYRYKNVDSVTYTHSCTVPLPGDECPLCGAGMVGMAGVDVSEYQQTIDWSTAAKSLRFAILRTSRGARTNGILHVNEDDKIRLNAKGCADNQLPYGVYHYARALTPEEAMTEANGVLDILGAILGETGSLPELPVFYDVENEAMLALSDEELLQVISAFCQAIEDAGFRAGVYSCKSVWNSRLTDPAYNSWVRWVAQWESGCMTASGGANIWQYSSTGRVDGIPTVVDLDYWLGPVGNEEHRYKVETAAPSCAEPGWIHYVCVECGYTITKPVASLPHTWDDGVVTAQPTCTQPGQKDYTCQVCGYVDNEQLPALGHRYRRTQTTAPTCTAEGVMSCTCTVCGYSCTEPIAALGHDFVSGVCTRCGAIQSVFARFEDLEPGKWYSDAVEFCVLNGLFNGVSENRFEPWSSMTRAMSVTVLYRVAGEPPVAASALFSDVPVSAWYALPIAWATQYGITEGTGEGSFSPAENVTRQQLAAFLFRYAGVAGLDVSARAPLDDFPDSGDVSRYAQEPLSWAVAVGLIQGSGEGDQVLLLPRSCATRAQVAVVMQRLCLLLQEHGLWSPPSA